MSGAQLLKHTSPSSLNGPADWWLDMLQPGQGHAWLNAVDPVHAVRTWNLVTLVAQNTAGHDGPDRRERAAKINARKRAVERAAWTDESGRMMYVRLELVSKSFDEVPGFLHRSEFTYRVVRSYDSPPNQYGGKK